MGLFGAPLAYRRALVELRGLRRAAERIADVLELQAQMAPRAGAQTFRGLSREKQPSDGQGTEVSYIGADHPEMLRRAEELATLLGRSPTDKELEAAFAGDVE